MDTTTDGGGELALLRQQLEAANALAAAEKARADTAEERLRAVRRAGPRIVVSAESARPRCPTVPRPSRATLESMQGHGVGLDGHPAMAPAALAIAATAEAVADLAPAARSVSSSFLVNERPNERSPLRIDAYTNPRHEQGMTALLCALMQQHFNRDDAPVCWLHQYTHTLEQGAPDIACLVAVDGMQVPVGTIEVGRGVTLAAKRAQAIAETVNFVQIQDNSTSQMPDSRFSVAATLCLANHPPKVCDWSVVGCLVSGEHTVKACFLDEGTGSALEHALTRIVSAFWRNIDMILVERANQPHWGYGGSIAKCPRKSFVHLQHALGKPLPSGLDGDHGALALKSYDYRFRPDAKYKRKHQHNIARMGAVSIVEQTDFVVIAWPWIMGEHHATTVGECVQMMQALKDVHAAGICHGDIRLLNLLFPNRIIDFDFAGPPGETKYPPGYNTSIGDGARHLHAVMGKQLEFFHDWFALGAALELHTLERESKDDEKNTWYRALGELKTLRVSSDVDAVVTKAIEDLGKIESLKLNPPDPDIFGNQDELGTGSPNRMEGLGQRKRSRSLSPRSSGNRS